MCEFSRPLPGPAAEVVTGAQRTIEASGGSLAGDARRGTITLSTPVGDISGDYEIQGDLIEFRITKKPLFVPCAVIEARVDSFLRR